MNSRIQQLGSRIVEKLPSSRRLEVVGHVASLVDVLTTVLLLGWAATEAHPLIAMLFDVMSPQLVAIASPVGVGVVLYTGRRVADWADLSDRQRAIGFTPVLGLLTWLALRNVNHLLETGLPASYQWAEFGLTAVATATVALTVYLHLHVSAYEILSKSEKARRKAVTSTCLVALLVLSLAHPIALFGADLSPVQSVNGASSNVVGDFESGDLSNWQGDTGKYSVRSTTSWEGTYSVEVDSGTTGNILETEFSQSDYKTMSFAIRDDTFGDGSDPRIMLRDSTGDSTTNLWFIAVDDGSNTGTAGTLTTYDYDAGTWVDTGIVLTEGDWYRVTFENIDYSSGNYDLVAVDKSGNVVGEYNDVPMDESGQPSQMAIQSDASSGEYFDYFTLNVEAKSGVSGTVESGDGTALSGANVTVKNGTGETITTTTTDSSGAYSVSLSDGDYTISANTDGYESSSKSVSVSGSDISGFDFSLRPTKYLRLGFDVEDYTGDLRFQSPDSLTVIRPDGSVTTTGPNHNDVFWADRFVCGQEYTLILYEGASRFEVKSWEATCVSGKVTTLLPGFTPGEDTLGEPPRPTEDTETDTELEELRAEFEELQAEYDSLNSSGSTVTYESPESIEELNYTITNESGAPIYKGSAEFDEPTDYYQIQLPENATQQVNESTGELEPIEDPGLNYAGEFSNGSTFNGSINFDEATAGVFGPVGGSSSSGGSGGSTLTGAALVAGVGYVGFRVVSNRSLTDAASSAASSVSRRFGGR